MGFVKKAANGYAHTFNFDGHVGQAARLKRDAAPQVKIVKVKGDKHMQKTINKYESEGWTLDQAASRKALYTLSLGVFTRKQIHTLTFRKGDGAVVAAIKATAPAPVSRPTGSVELLNQLAELRDAGILTGEEFDSKKGELLKQI